MTQMQNDARLRHLVRSDVYRLLSACFYQPDEAFLEEDLFGQLAETAARLDPASAEAAAGLDGAFRTAGIDALTLDYSRLFLGPFGVLAKPYGSTYLDGEQIVMGNSTMEAVALYREGGFEVGDAFHEAPDHVALEFEFLHLLSHRIGNAADGEERERLAALKRRFLAEHLGRWIGDFAAAMRGGAETDFYRRLADMVEAVLRAETRELAGAA